jgi:5-methylcytosine-specific restriction endonuclease McrA
MWHSLWHSLATAYMASPALSVVTTLIIGLAAINATRTSYWRQTRRDPIRLFNRLDKALILGRAGGRCEHHAAIFGRCIVTDKLEADHIHPHSRGGRTVISNGQALYHRHNQQKLARIPWAWERRRLETRHQAYFPAGTTTTVSRRSLAELKDASP